MKIKPAEKSGGVIVELGPKESQLPSPAREPNDPTLPVFQLKKILVPVDFSRCTEKALFYAVPFARKFDAELTLLHVQEPLYMPAPEIGGIPEVESVDEALRELEELRDKLDDHIRCKTLVRKGNIQYEILNVAEDLGSDLIIISTHGRTGFDRVVMGSTAEKLVRRAGCPVLIVREKEHEFITCNYMEAHTRTGTTDIEAEMRTGL